MTPEKKIVSNQKARQGLEPAKSKVQLLLEPIVDKR